MSATTSHTAGPQAAGYLYQCERALVELIARAENPDVALFLEQLDDVHLEEHGSAVEILQLKHHTGSGGDLADKSVDLWRSLAVWLDLFDELAVSDAPILALVSTSSAPADSAAALLAPDARDPDRAVELLEAAARDSTNQQTEPARRRFLALDLPLKRRLVAAIEVRGEEPRLTDLDGEISRGLSLHLMLQDKQRQLFIDRLKGWWYGQCVAMLTTSGRGVASTDLALFVQELRESFHPEDLPPSFDLDDPSEAEVASYESRLFVAQMKWIMYTNDQLLDAIRDYHRAFTQRSRWMREGLVYPGEIDEYKHRLVEQWQRVFHDRQAEVAAADEAGKERAGRELLQGLRDSSVVRLRPRYSEVFLTHGTLHDLSDGQAVGWHPDFAERLRELLEGAA